MKDFEAMTTEALRDYAREMYSSIAKLSTRKELLRALLREEDKRRIVQCCNEWDDAIGAPAPCWPIACDAGQHVPRCYWDESWEL